MQVPLEVQLMLIGNGIEDGWNTVFKAFRRAVEVEAARRGLDWTNLLKRYGLHSKATRLQRGGTGEPDDYRKLADMLRKMGLSIEVDERSMPWNGWEDGDTARVVIGDRAALGKANEGKLRPNLVGGGDVKALAQLISTAERQLRIQAEWDIKVLPANMPENDAIKTYRNCLLRDPEKSHTEQVGALFVIGSPFTNPLADLVARRIMQPKPNQEAPPLPYRFYWHGEGPKDRLKNYLSFPSWCTDPKKEGIYQAEAGDEPLVGENGYRRAHDSEILEGIKNPSLEGNPYPDCGILMMSCRPGEPILCLLAGHGGLGTVATALALTKQSQISQWLEETENKGVKTPEHVAFVVVEVSRRKPTPYPIDDLDFNCRSDWEGRGWRIASPVEDEETT